MESIKIIAIIEGIILCILFLLIIFRKIGRPLTEYEVKIKEKKKADKRRKKQEEEHRKYESLEKLERLAKSLVYPIIVMDYRYNDDFIYYAYLRDSKCVMLSVENLRFDIYKVNPCPTVYALVRACANKKNMDKIN